MADDSQPLKKRVRELEQGMTLAKPVHTKDGSRLFSEGKTIEIEDIERLKNWKIRQVYVNQEDGVE